MIKRVLLIDDDQDDAELFADALKELEPVTIFDHFEDGVKALGGLTKNGVVYPDIIFLDINMPLLNGWDCLREIKKVASLAGIPIIMFSTANMHNIGINPSDVGAAAFMTKPDSYALLKKNLADLFHSLSIKLL
jgi:CheY-like chemotaxis protein